MNMNMMSSSGNYYANNNNNLTTHHIQQYLDENKSLILKIVESQNSGKLSECAEENITKKLGTLAIIDIEPIEFIDDRTELNNILLLYARNQARLQRNLMYLAAIADSQPQPTMHSQYGQSGMMQSGPHYLHAQQAARSSMLYTQQQYSALQQQQALNSQLGMGSSGGTHMLQTDTSGFVDLRGMTGGGGSKQQDIGRSSSGDGDDNN